jgi:hypothetical protein
LADIALSISLKETPFLYLRCFRDQAVQTIGKVIGKEKEKNSREAIKMAVEIAGKVLTKEEQYADAEYRRFLKDKDKYKDFDEFCREQGI